MEARTLEFMREATGGEFFAGGGEVVVKGIFTDSRAPMAEGVFLAVMGERFDGHDFVGKVGEAGCRAFIVSRTEGIDFPVGSTVLKVADTVAAYGQIAAAYRRQFSKLVVIAVCGSNGKTTTKDMIAAVLARRGAVVASERSFNNQIGVPGTLLRITSQHEYAVVEVGTNHPGELKPLLQMVAPDYGVLTSIGHEHLEFFKSVEGVVEEEGTLAEVLPADGGLFINQDSVGVDAITKRLKPGVMVKRVGLGEYENDFNGRLLGVRPEGTDFSVKWRGGGSLIEVEYYIRPVGAQHVTNAMLAIAVGWMSGVATGKVQDALAECPASDMRSQVEVVHGVTILKDCYNANLESVKAALETLRMLPCGKIGNRIAILGTMSELGESALEAHQEVGRMAARLWLDYLFLYGEYAKEMKVAFESEGSEVTKVRLFDTMELLIKEVSSIVSKGDCVLVKASRSQRFEQIVESLERGL